MTEPAHETSLQKSTENAVTEAQAAATPQTSTVVTRTPNGSCQSTVTVTVQVTTTLGPPAQPAVPQKVGDDGDTDGDSGSKGGLGGVERSSDEDDTEGDPGSKSGLRGRE